MDTKDAARAAVLMSAGAGVTTATDVADSATSPVEAKRKAEASGAG